VEKPAAIIPVERIQKCILLIRKQKVILDNDLAVLYGVETKTLNQSVRRNIRRFPSDFMFQLTKVEKEQLVTNCDRFEPLKHSTSLPHAFTEQGVAMLSSVLRSQRAIEVNIAIMRAFVKLREILADNAALRRKVEEHDVVLKQIFELLKAMMEEREKPREPFGFRSRKKLTT